jgi:uroporphyrinogen-III synthase
MTSSPLLALACLVIFTTAYGVIFFHRRLPRKYEDSLVDMALVTLAMFSVAGLTFLLQLFTDTL